jgi:hypothetical protein
MMMNPTQQHSQSLYISEHRPINLEHPEFKLVHTVELVTSPFQTKKSGKTNRHFAQLEQQQEVRTSQPKRNTERRPLSQSLVI